MNKTQIAIGSQRVGEGQPVYVVAEIGINHNGSLEVAKKLIEGAALAGCDAVKFQKRTPEKCVPRDQWSIERDTPWGRMTYIDYRYKVEFGKAEFADIDAFCKAQKIQWFASCWDEDAVDFIAQFDVPAYKAASASLTDHALLKKMKATGKPLMISTGMSTMDEIARTVSAIGEKHLLMAHATSTYPCPLEQLNLRMIHTLKALYPTVPVGYSGHETGLAPSLAAVAFGATFLERHITLDRAMWGSDQAASVELPGLIRLVQGVRDIEKSVGDGVKRVYDEELSQRKKLRRVRSEEMAHPAVNVSARAASGRA